MNAEWRPRNQIQTPLSAREQEFLQMKSKAEFFNYAKYGKIEFHTESSQAKNKHDDTVIKTWYNDEDGTTKAAYGIIQKMFKHSMYPGGDIQVMIEVEWLEDIALNEEEKRTKLPRVRRNPSSNFNRFSRITALSLCAGYNIMIAPHNPMEIGPCNTYDVIDRWRMYHDHSL